MIPKIIHYCWFGCQPKPKYVEEYLANWKKINPDFEIIEWNESNFDVKLNSYVREAYNAKKWAFVSDYARIFALYRYGGIYLDTDVELVKPFNPFLKHKAFIGIESEFSICTAVIGASERSIFIKKIIDSYDNEHFILNGIINNTPNSQRLYNILSENNLFTTKSKSIQIFDDCVIYPQDYFSPINCYTGLEDVTNRTVAIHRYAGTWKSNREKFKDKIVALITRVIGEKRRQHIKKLMKRFK